MSGNEDNFRDIDPDTHHFDLNLDLNLINFEQHSVNSFIDIQDPMPKSLKIIHHNARSLMKIGRLDEYHLYLHSLKNPFDILIFTETWLTQDKIDHCKFDDYQPIHLIRPIDNHVDFNFF